MSTERRAHAIRVTGKQVADGKENAAGNNGPAASINAKILLVKMLENTGKIVLSSAWGLY